MVTPFVTPFARALALLAAFGPRDRWLGNRELGERTGLPASTVARFTQTLVHLGYLQHDAVGHRYRLAPSVLALGYGAAGPADVQQAARGHMRRFAEQHQVHVTLSSRDRLDLVVLENCAGAQAPAGARLDVGARTGVGSSPQGWALLAALPEPERYYLLDSVERRSQRDWPRLRRRSSEAISQVQRQGFCLSTAEERAPALGVVAAPVRIPGQAPLVLACVGWGTQLTRTRVERDLGPRLLALADAIQPAGALQ